MNVDFAKFLAITAMMSAPLVTACDLSGGDDDEASSNSGAGTGDETPTTGATGSEGTGDSADDGSGEGTSGGTAADETAGPADSTGGSVDPGTCCTINDAPGCSDEGIEACVCKADEFCCSPEGSWDEACVGLAVTECGVDCPEDPATTGEATTGEVGGDCCLPQETPGCDDPKIETCVCDMDPFCCGDTDGTWDQTCVELATTGCFAECA